MVIITESQYPWSSTISAVEALGKIAETPDFVKISGPFSTAEKGVGLRVLSLYEFDNTRYREVIDFITKRMLNFMTVPDYTWSMTPFYEMDEALKLLE